MNPTNMFPAETSQWLKDQFYVSRPLQYPYLVWMDLQSRTALARRKPFVAAGHMLHAWRQLGNKGFIAGRVARLMEIVNENCYRDGQLVMAAENRLRLEFVQSEKARKIRSLYGGYPMAHRVRLRHPNDDDSERQGDLMVLKRYNPATGERGVLMLMYSEAILAMAAVYDLGLLATQYMLVLEPSSWGYQDVRFLLYLGSDLDCLIQSPRHADFEFIQSLRTNLIAIRVGAGEWVDPAIFQPRSKDQAASFDVCMVAAWDPLKRHKVFLQAAAKLQRENRSLRFALIGYDMGWKRDTIERLLRQYDLQRHATIYENIPHANVANIVADSSMSLLLSQREGASRAIYESMFCDTPIIVYRHQCGVNLDHVNSRTGLLADDEELADAIKTTLDHPELFGPRMWAMENAGYTNATDKINRTLREMAQRRRYPWTTDIVAKKNAPNLRYAERGIHKDFAAEYERLSEFLLPLN